MSEAMPDDPGAPAGYGPVDPGAATEANRRFWDSYEREYLAEHGAYLGDDDLLWCPEGVRESDAGLLGDVRAKLVLEVGCGAAQGSRWVAGQGGRAIGLDISGQMLAAARRRSHPVAGPAGGPVLIQGDALALPFADGAFDIAFTAYGAIPFVADIGRLHREVARVLAPGGRWVFSTSHPVRWAFPDDPGERGLTVTRSYFDTRPYRELAPDGSLAYAEFHHTVSEHVAALAGAGFVIKRIDEPAWQPGVTHTWGGWSQLRGRMLPGTILVAATRP